MPKIFVFTFYCRFYLQEKLFVKQVKKRKQRQVLDKQKEEEMKENLAGHFRQQAYWTWLFFYETFLILCYLVNLAISDTKIRIIFKRCYLWIALSVFSVVWYANSRYECIWLVFLELNEYLSICNLL